MPIWNNLNWKYANDPCTILVNHHILILFVVWILFHILWLNFFTFFIAHYLSSFHQWLLLGFALEVYYKPIIIYFFGKFQFFCYIISFLVMFNLSFYFQSYLLKFLLIFIDYHLYYLSKLMDINSIYYLKLIPFLIKQKFFC